MLKKCSLQINWKSIIIIVVFAITGCSKIEVDSRQDIRSQSAIEQTEEGKLVNKYMELISAGNLEEANKFLCISCNSDEKPISTLYKTDGDNPNLSWSSVLYERNLILRKVTEVRTDAGKTQVYANLASSKSQDVNILAVFYLTKEGGNLLIKNIELKPGKTY